MDLDADKQFLGVGEIRQAAGVLLRSDEDRLQGLVEAGNLQI